LLPRRRFSSSRLSVLARAATGASSDRPMLVIMQSGLATSLSRWAHMRVEGDLVVLLGPSKEGGPGSSLVVAELRSEGEAQAMFRTINQRILLKARRFDACDWPGLIRRGATHATREGLGE
jgi:hypothetical protein